MKVETEGKILSADSKPYDFDGRKGVSHRVRVLIEGDIYSLKATPELVKDLAEKVDEEGRLTVKFSSRKETLSAELIDFELA